MTFKELQLIYRQHNSANDCDCEYCRDYRELNERILGMSVIRLFEALLK